MKITRKLVMSIVSLMLLAITLTTTTYAWFQGYFQVVVEGFNISATGGQGFLISIDDTHYYNDLTKEKLLSAILLSLDKVENPDNPQYELKNEILCYAGTSDIVPETTKEDLISNMKLKPRTSQDGINFEDLYGSTVTLKDKSYISFDIYFKQASENPDENLKYDIYLYGDEDKTLENGVVIKKTEIKSSRLDVDLRTNLTTYDLLNKVPVTYNKNYLLETYASNALRMSALDYSKNNGADIYELTNDKDLGSYATTYRAENDLVSTEEEKELKTKLYDCRYNAGYTYYNNLRNGLLIGKELKYTKQKEDDYILPATIRDIRSSNTNLPTITHVESGGLGKKVTFTIWLEGWDADCFDGIANNVNVNLSFTSKKVN